MNDVSKCAEINCSSFDNLHFPLGDVRDLGTSSYCSETFFEQFRSLTLVVIQLAVFGTRDNAHEGYEDCQCMFMFPRYTI